MLKTLLRVTALAEGGRRNGLACLVVPALPSELLFGQPTTTPLDVVLGRFVGAVLLSLTLACWFAASDSGTAVFGVVKAMLFYDVVVIVVFLCARFELSLAGILLWPAIAIHVALAILLVWAWRKKQQPVVEIETVAAGRDLSFVFD